MKQSFTGKLVSPRYMIGWYIVAFLTGAGLIASLPGYYLRYVSQPVGLHFNSLQIALTLVNGLSSIICALICITLATIIFLRKPADRFAIFVSFFLLLYGFFNCGPLEMIEYQVFHQTGFLSTHLSVILLTAPLIILLLTFPNGVVIPGKFRWIIPLSIPVSLVLGLLSNQEINSITSLRSKFLYSIISFLFLLSLGAQVYRYLKKSSPGERQQTKVAVYGLGVMGVFMLLDAVIYFQIPDFTKNVLDPYPNILGILWWFSIAILPISFALAVIRSHLWDIDFLIRRTLVYGLLTTILVLLYFVSVIIVQSLIQLIIGHSSPVALVISTLAVAGLFNPLRSQVQSLIDRHFFRSKYNFEQTMAHFQSELRERIDLIQVESDLISIVQTTIQPETIGLWIRKTAAKEEFTQIKYD